MGCESCHGRGGPHLTPGFITAGNYQPACANLSQSDPLARIRVRELPAPRLPRGERRDRQASARGEAQAARRSRSGAQGPAADQSRVRGIGGLPQLPRGRAPDLERVAARARGRDARRRPQAGQPGLPALPHHRLRPPRRLPREGPARGARGPLRGRLRILSRAGRRSRRRGRGQDRHDHLAQRQVRLLRDPADLRHLSRRRQRPGLRVRGEAQDRKAAARNAASPAPANPRKKRSRDSEGAAAAARICSRGPSRVSTRGVDVGAALAAGGPRARSPPRAHGSPS